MAKGQKRSNKEVKKPKKDKTKAPVAPASPFARVFDSKTGKGKPNG